MTDELRYPRICVVLGHLPSPSETFLQAHIDRLPGRNSVAYGWLPILNGQPIRSPSILRAIARKIVRQSRNQCWQEELTDAYVKAFERCRADAVLVEYGDNAVMFREACQRVGIPLIAHFHGYDASLNKCLQEMEDEYPLLFRDAAAIVAVSQAMRTQLIRLAHPRKKFIGIRMELTARISGQQPCGRADDISCCWSLHGEESAAPDFAGVCGSSS